MADGWYMCKLRTQKTKFISDAQGYGLKSLDYTPSTHETERIHKGDVIKKAGEIKNLYYQKLNKIQKLQGTVAEQLADNYLGDPKEGIGADITNMIGDVAAEVADHYVPGSGDVVKFTFGGLANSIQAAINQKSRSNIIKSMLAAKKQGLMMVDSAKITAANKTRAKSIITSMYSDVNADVPVLAARLKELLAGNEDPKDIEQKAKDATIPGLAAYNKAIKTDPFPTRATSGKNYPADIAAWYGRHPDARNY